MFLVCYGILQDHVVIWSCQIMSRSHSRLLTIQPSLVAIEILVNDILVNRHLVIFGGHNHSGCGDIIFSGLSRGLEVIMLLVPT